MNAEVEHCSLQELAVDPVTDDELETRINECCRRMIAAGPDKIIANAWGEIMVSLIRRRSPEQIKKMEIERGIYRGQS